MARRYRALDRALLVEGVTLIVIGVIAASLFIGLSLRILGPYAPLQGSELPENPSYLELYYNITGNFSTSPSGSGGYVSGWALGIVKITEESPDNTVIAIGFNGTGGSPEGAVLTEYAAICTYKNQPTYELDQCLIWPAPNLIMNFPPIDLINFINNVSHVQPNNTTILYVNGTPQLVYVESYVENISYVVPGYYLNNTFYYRLSDGVMLKGSITVTNATTGLAVAQLNYTLVKEQVLSPFVAAPTPVERGLLYFSFGVMALVAGVGIVVGVDRLVKAAG